MGSPVWSPPMARRGSGLAVWLSVSIQVTTSGIGLGALQTAPGPIYTPCTPSLFFICFFVKFFFSSGVGPLYTYAAYIYLVPIQPLVRCTPASCSLPTATL